MFNRVIAVKLLKIYDFRKFIYFQGVLIFGWAPAIAGVLLTFTFTWRLVEQLYGLLIKDTLIQI